MPTIEELLQKRHKIGLQNLYMPEGDQTGLVTSRHVVICVSGFLSEEGNYAQSWENLVIECRARNVPLYTV